MRPVGRQPAVRSRREVGVGAGPTPRGSGYPPRTFTALRHLTLAEAIQRQLASLAICPGRLQLNLRRLDVTQREKGG